MSNGGGRQLDRTNRYCALCGKPFPRDGKRKYCSPEHAADAKRGTTNAWKARKIRERALCFANSSGLAAFPNLGVAGGTIAGNVKVVPTGALTTDAVLFDAGQLAAASDGFLLLNNAEHANVELADDPTSGAPVRQFVSLWADNLRRCPASSNAVCKIANVATA